MILAVRRQTTLLSASDFSAMVAAVARQVAEHVAPAVGIEPVGVETFDLEEPPADSIIIRLVDQSDDGDLGWHSEAGTLPFGVVEVGPILAAGGGALTGTYPDAPSVSSVLSHEACETVVDLNARLWEDADGVQYALEVCDPVEGCSYQIDGVDVSDFVLPSWFEPGSLAPYSFRGNAPGPFRIAAGGYAITRAADGSTSMLFGDRPPAAWRLRGRRATRRMGT